MTDLNKRKNKYWKPGMHLHSQHLTDVIDGQFVGESLATESVSCDFQLCVLDSQDLFLDCFCANESKKAEQ